MYSIKQRVRYSEADHTKHLTLTGIVNYFQDCSTFQSEDIGLGIEFLESHRRGWVLSSWQIIVHRYPKIGETIEVGTWPTGFDKLYGTRNFVMKDENGEILACANSIWVFMDMEKGRPTKPTEEEIRAYELEPEFPMKYAPRKIDLPEGWEEIPAFPVRKAQIDTNGHVNNSRYIEMALELLPKEWSLGQVRVEYKKSAVYGDRIYPMLHEEENTMIVKLCDEDGRLFAAVEFTGEQ